MASFSVDCSKIKSQAAALEGIEKKLNALQGDIRQVQNALSLHGSAGGSVRRAVGLQASEISEYGRKADSLAVGLRNVAAVYIKAENTIKGVEVRKREFDWTSLLAFPHIPGLLNLVLSSLSSFGKGWIGEEVADAWLKGSVSGEGPLFGISTSGELYGELFGTSNKKEFGVKVKYKEKDGKMVFDELGIGAEVSGEAHVAKGKAKGSIGFASGSIEAALGKVSAGGSIGAALFKDGKLSPQLYAKASAKAVAAEGSINGQLGNDDVNAHAKASGEVFTAEAKAEGAIGEFTYKDDATGETKTAFGVKGTVGAEAYAASGKVSGGITILGVKIDVGVSGHAGGVGGKIGGYIGSGGAKGTIGAGLGLGLGLDVSVDWSNFKWPWEK